MKRLQQLIIPALALAVLLVGLGLVTRLFQTRAKGEELLVPSKPRPVKTDLTIRRLSAIEPVLDKHLFVPARSATGQNAFPELLIKGVYHGPQTILLLGMERRSNETVQLVVGEEEEVASLARNTRDPLYPLYDFFHKWRVHSVTSRHVAMIKTDSGKIEHYPIHHQPRSIRKAPVAGYGEGNVPAGAPRRRSSKKRKKK